MLAGCLRIICTEAVSGYTNRCLLAGVEYVSNKPHHVGHRGCNFTYRTVWSVSIFGTLLDEESELNIMVFLHKGLKILCQCSVSFMAYRQIFLDYLPYLGFLV